MGWRGVEGMDGRREKDGTVSSSSSSSSSFSVFFIFVFNFFSFPIHSLEAEFIAKNPPSTLYLRGIREMGQRK
ncbi:hypothetical protein L249_6337 [Ophiocordyceps polyrhachis-furcata BCC 54312]|uniref:Uncharacterized protein n=1 Tax=Ophiocordyceps polyrhachis-furcata BCC 54312 TaxID=1330021 RepID=A0A367L129_9HYPO|nr:hypothetical protein L249_6337 [Ophiocordyceps polyrhachis-furcata BCC 54312]